jgi:hypothetical protein
VGWARPKEEGKKGTGPSGRDKEGAKERESPRTGEGLEGVFIYFICNLLKSNFFSLLNLK